MIAASPAKLRDGSWGVRVSGSVGVGDRVQVTARSGKSWPARVTAVVATFADGALCRTAGLDGGPKRSASKPSDSRPRRSQPKRSAWKRPDPAVAPHVVQRKSGSKPGIDDSVGETFRAGKRCGALAGKVLTVVAQRRDYQSQEDAEDFGDCEGGWTLTLYCRDATPEEEAKLAEREGASAESAARHRGWQALLALGRQLAAAAVAREIEARDFVHAGDGFVPDVPGLRQVELYRWRGQDGGYTAWSELWVDDLLLGYRRDYGTGDDWRFGSFVAPATAAQMWQAWADSNGITPAKAQEWLSRFAGCSGGEAYQFIAGQCSDTVDAELLDETARMLDEVSSLGGAS